MDCKKFNEIYKKSCIELLEKPPKFVDKRVIEANELKILNCLNILTHLETNCRNKEKQ